MSTEPTERVRLVLGESVKGDGAACIALLQMALALEFGNFDYETTASDEKTNVYPCPYLVLPDGRVYWQPLSAACELLRVEDPTAVVVESSDIANRASRGIPTAVPKSLVGQIVLFSVLHVTKQKVSDELATFASEFVQRPEVWKALSRIGLEERPAQCVREGVAWKQDSGLKKIPMGGQRNILITAALPYVNNVPHLGNIIGSLLSADVFARYCRLRGYNTLYISGTDEYGTTTETKALEEGMSCEEVCAKYYRIHASVYKWFQIRCDIFGRTSTEKQTHITHDIFKRLYENGYFFEQSVEQTFCERCSRFLADRFVEGTCPLCGFDDARGDQCDACGKLLNSVDLITPKCKLCKHQPVIRSSRHLFLDLSKLQSTCERFVEDSSTKGNWSANSASIAKSWLTEGLKPRCMTRDMKWGTSVPLSGFEDKVFYVWFDAPIGYISITACYTDEWEKWWKNPENVQLYQFMGKDNVPFHTVIFPSTLLGTNTPFTLLHHINTTEYLNYESGKFSKSRGTGVFGNDARDSGIPASMWRYYLLSNRPESSDSVFTWDDFAAKVNSELLANFGNFVNRSCKFLSAKMNGTVGDVVLTEYDETFIGKVNGGLQEYLDCMENVKLRAGIKAVMGISSLGNLYLQESRLDNKLLLNEPERCNTVIGVAVNLCYLLSALVAPFLPSVADDICRILNAPPRSLSSTFTIDLLAGHTINSPFHLFRKLDDGLVSELRTKYGGKQN